MKDIKWLEEKVKEEVKLHQDRMDSSYSSLLYDQYKHRKQALEPIIRLIEEANKENEGKLDLNKLNEANEGTGIVMTTGTVFLTEAQAEWIEHWRKHSKEYKKINELELIEMAKNTTLKKINELVEKSPINLIHAFRGMYEIKESSKDVYRIKLGGNYYLSGIEWNDNYQKIIVAHAERNPELIRIFENKEQAEIVTLELDGEMEKQ